MDPWRFWFSVMWVPLVLLASDCCDSSPGLACILAMLFPLSTCSNVASSASFSHPTTGETLRYIQPLGLKVDSKLDSKIVEVGQAGGWKGVFCEEVVGQEPARISQILFRFHCISSCSLFPDKCLMILDARIKKQRKGSVSQAWRTPPPTTTTTTDKHTQNDSPKSGNSPSHLGGSNVPHNDTQEWRGVALLQEDCESHRERGKASEKG